MCKTSLGHGEGKRTKQQNTVPYKFLTANRTGGKQSEEANRTNSERNELRNCR
ncbi:hypothetical protein PITCH_A2090004 [uncultured Desulfobacterium sp.]|uniref:Uncharacterized protein n=1 Tax=uncultured Desulfobacterium sp. TaxID=201089 RepID=A0A445MXS4_9BACT|nr:hypothetical protein PITCH_A2090004 [uncultured Desulfobacterium sp.]